MLFNPTQSPWQYWENVGEIRGQNDCHPVCDIRPHGEGHGADQNRSNARLIASAPELLELVELANEYRMDEFFAKVDKILGYIREGYPYH